MKKRRRYRFQSGINGVDRYYYPYRYTPAELNGTKYLDICPEFLGQDQMFANTDPEGSYTGVPRRRAAPGCRRSLSPVAFRNRIHRKKTLRCVHRGVLFWFCCPLYCTPIAL